MKSLFGLAPDVCFLNHGSYGACPRVVIDAWQAIQREAEAQPVAFHNALAQAEMHGFVRAALAAELGAEADDLVHVVNATQGLNVAARSLDLRPGDEILTTDHEYAALDKTWAAVCRDTGAVVRRAVVPMPHVSDQAFCDAFWAAATDRTRVVFLSHITSATALVFPVAQVVAEARARGLVTVIDGAHAPGQIPLALDAIGADFYAGNCHKWLMAPKGSAFLHVRREWQDRVRPLAISHGWTEEGREGPFGGTAFIDRMEMQGTRDASAWFAVPAALTFRREWDWWTVVGACREMAGRTAEKIGAMTGLPALSSEALRAPQMVAIPVPDCDPAALKARLLDDWTIEVPCYRWQDRCIVRLSVQGYVTEGHCDTLALALKSVFGLPSWRKE